MRKELKQRRIRYLRLEESMEQNFMTLKSVKLKTPRTAAISFFMTEVDTSNIGQEETATLHTSLSKYDSCSNVLICFA
jgi:hypothetical protein